MRPIAALAAIALTLAGCGSDAPGVPGAGELEEIRGELLDSYRADRFGAALDDVTESVGADATLLRVEVIPTRISFDVLSSDGTGSTYLYDGQGAFERMAALRTPDERKAFPLTLVRRDAPERISDQIRRVTGLSDLKFNSAYLQVSVFERGRGPVWSEGGGNSSGQSVSYEATPQGELIEQVGGTLEP